MLRIIISRVLAISHTFRFIPCRWTLKAVCVWHVQLQPGQEVHTSFSFMHSVYIMNIYSIYVCQITVYRYSYNIHYICMTIVYLSPLSTILSSNNHCTYLPSSPLSLSKSKSSPLSSHIGSSSPSMSNTSVVLYLS